MIIHKSDCSLDHKSNVEAGIADSDSFATSRTFLAKASMPSEDIVMQFNIKSKFAEGFARRHLDQS